MKRTTVWFAGALMLWLGGLTVGLTGCGGDAGGAVASGDDALPATAFSRMVPAAEVGSDTGAVTGEVTDAAGSPVAGAAVTVTDGGRQSGEVSFCTVTDDAGGFAVGQMAPGAYRLSFLHEGVGSASVEIDVEAGEVAGAGRPQLRPQSAGGVGGGEFGERPGAGQGGGDGPIGDLGAIVGYVYDEAGDPIARARLNVGGRRFAVTGETGAFALVVPPGTHTVACRAQGYEPAEQDVEVASGEAAQITFTLVPGEDDGEPEGELVAITGTVLDADTEAPLADVTLRLGRELEATTSSDGSFTFADLRPGRYLLLARVDGYRPFEMPLVATPAHQEPVEVLLAPLPEGEEITFGRLEVTVLSAADNQPLRGAHVSLDGRRPFVTDDSGQVIVEEIPSGTHRMRVAAREHRPVHQTVEIAADETTTVEVVLEAGAPEDGERPDERPGQGPDGERPGQGQRPGGA